MSILSYQTEIIRLIAATNNENLLKIWKAQLEWDLEHEDEINLIAPALTTEAKEIQLYENNSYPLSKFVRRRV